MHKRLLRYRTLTSHRNKSVPHIVPSERDTTDCRRGSPAEASYLWDRHSFVSSSMINLINSRKFLSLWKICSASWIIPCTLGYNEGGMMDAKLQCKPSIKNNLWKFIMCVYTIYFNLHYFVIYDVYSLKTFIINHAYRRKIRRNRYKVFWKKEVFMQKRVVSKQVWNSSWYKLIDAQRQPLFYKIILALVFNCIHVYCNFNI